MANKKSVNQGPKQREYYPHRVNVGCSVEEFARKYGMSAKDVIAMVERGALKSRKPDDSDALIVFPRRRDVREGLLPKPDIERVLMGPIMRDKELEPGDGASIAWGKKKGRVKRSD